MGGRRLVEESEAHVVVGLVLLLLLLLGSLLDGSTGRGLTSGGSSGGVTISKGRKWKKGEVERGQCGVGR
jgi:hypothetical protein